MDFLDNAIDKAKEAIDIAYKKTNQVVNTGKQKFDIASLQNKCSKDFEALGKIYYELIKNTEIAELKEEVNAAKCKRTCPVCAAAINENSVYCSACGAKLELEE